MACPYCDDKGWVLTTPTCSYYTEHGDLEREQCEYCKGDYMAFLPAASGSNSDKWPNHFDLVRICGGASMGTLYCKPQDMQALLKGLGPGIRIYDVNADKAVAQIDDNGHVWICPIYACTYPDIQGVRR